MIRPIQSIATVVLSTMVSTAALAADPAQSGGQDASFTPVPSLDLQTSTGLTEINTADYILGPGDELKLDMYGQEELFATPYSVLVDGTISLPFVGRVNVAGKTIREMEADVTVLYKRYFKRPYVTIVLTKPRELTLGISGEVTKPGTYPVSGAAQVPTVTQLIKLAGGVTPSADLRKVQVRRSKFGQPGAYEVVSLNLMSLLQEGDLDQDIRLRDGDTVLVPAGENLSLTDFSLSSSSSFAASTTEPLKIAVVGEVFRPGPYTVQAGNTRIGEAGNQGVTTNSNNTNLPTVSQAIQLAGGIKPEADVRKIQVRRLTKMGNEQLLTVDLWKMLVQGDIQQDIPLQEGDTVIIAKTATPLTPEEQQFIAAATISPETIDVNVVGEVKAPGTVKIRPNTPLSTAVLSAGGFDGRRANTKSVKLIRLNPDGTVTERKIKIAFDAPVSEDRNPALRNNDVIVVGKSGLTAFSDTFSAIFSPVTGASGLIRSFLLF